MTFIKEIESVRYFDFWGGAEQVANQINSRDDADKIWNDLDEYFSNFDEVPSETEVNDFVWFEAEDYLKNNFGIDLYSDDEDEEESENEKGDEEVDE